MDRQKEDFDWFVQNYQSLFEQYGFSYLAIKNCKVIGVYNTYAEGVKETAKTEEPGSYIVQLCSGKESAYTNCIASMFAVVG